ncbi:MAG: hypothetical protein HY940_06890 [Gammaproteobacteria bacterium]|nr:hypothetical protein [Gammaproteobacteria bacterium]
MADIHRYQLVQDRRGLTWDALLYIPTVIALLSIGAKIWFSADQTWAYVLFFMASFFALVGANRILGGRLMLLPSSPRALQLDRQQMTLELNRGKVVLVKDLRYYPDYAGKSFGLAGLDGEGKRHQFVLYRGQFADLAEYRDLNARLAAFK